MLIHNKVDLGTYLSMEILCLGICMYALLWKIYIFMIYIFMIIHVLIFSIYISCMNSFSRFVFLLY